MYLQITTRCNYKCSHCCFDCTSIGTYMDLETVEAAITNPGLYFERRFDNDLTLGGGEPTLHPSIMEIAKMAVDVTDGNAWMVTNGSHPDVIEKLARIGLHIRISGDQFHRRFWSKETKEFIAGWGKRFFTPETLAPKDTIRLGRGYTVGGKAGNCGVSGPIVYPDGTVALCGCPNAPVIGIADNAQIPVEGETYGAWYCHALDGDV